MKTIIPGNTKFCSLYADSNPEWTVIKPKGAGVYLCEILKDGDWQGVQKVFMAEEIINFVQHDQHLLSLHKTHNDFYASLTEGQIIHYDNGFGNWVRCVVVKQDNKFGTYINVLKPIALVGTWSKNDLPHRYANGTVHYPYYAEKIKNGTAFTPNASNLYEYKKLCGKVKDNPTALPPIELTVPPLSENEARKAELWTKVEEIHKALQNNDPAVILQKITEIVTGQHHTW